MKKSNYTIQRVITLVTLFAFALSFTPTTFAASRTTPFSVGETLDPGLDAQPCGPTDANCFPSLNTLQPVGTTTGSGGIMKFMELLSNGVNSVGFRAPDSVTTDIVWTLPTGDGSASSVLTTNGNGILSWTIPGASGNTTAGYFVATSTTATSTFAGGLAIGTNGFLFDLATRNVGIGTTSPYAKLSVVGNVVADSFAATSTTATSTFTAGVNVGAGNGYFVNGASAVSGGPGALTSFGFSNTLSSSGQAFGNFNTISNIGSLAFGNSNTTSGAFGVAFGYTNIASNTNSIALGSGNTASGLGSVAIGRGVTNTTANSLQIGPSDAAKLTILSSGNLGIGTTSPYAKLSVVGNVVADSFTATSTTATSTFTAGVNVGAGNGYFVNGASAVSGANNAQTSFGFSNAVSSSGVAFGNSNISSAVLSTAFGNTNTSSGFASAAFGYGNQASSTASVAFGILNNAGGGNSIAIGLSNSVFATGGVALGAGITNNTANSLQIGPSDTAKLTILSSGNLGIGTTSPYAKLSVVGEVVADSFNATSSAGYKQGGMTLLTASSTGYNTFLGLGVGTSTTNGARNTFVGYQVGQASSVGFDDTAVGYRALFSNTNGYYNSAFGSNALTANTTGYNNVAFGFQSLQANTTGYGNTATGRSSLSLNTTGYENVANGYNSMTSNINGIWNTAIGVESLRTNISGSANTALGHQALYLNTIGNNNVAVGGSALSQNNTGSYNVANGASALLFNTTGSYNTANGMNALFSNTTGASSTAVGYSAGRSNTTGNFNTFLGFNAGYTDGVTTTPGTLTNATAIGYNAQVTANNSLILGGTGAYAVNVGIGTTSPNAKLNTYSTITANGQIGGLSVDLTIPALPGGSVYGNKTTLRGSLGVVPPTTNVYLNHISSGATCVGCGLSSIYGSYTTFATEGSNAGKYAYYADTFGAAVGATTNFFANLNDSSNSYGYIASSSSSFVGDFLHFTKGGSSILRVNGSGNVGIGTTSPYAKLSVVGNVVADSFTATSTTATSTFTAGVNVGTGNGYSIGGNNVLSGSIAGGIVGFGNTNTSSGGVAMGISNSSTGFAGTAIGISNTVSSTLGTAIGYSNTANNFFTTAIGYANAASASNALAMGFINTASAVGSVAIGANVNNSIANSLQIGPSDATKMTILQSGNVGIGTSTPWAKLSVQNTYGNTSALFDIATTTSSGFATSSIFSVNAAGTVTLRGINNGNFLSPNIFTIATSSTGNSVVSVNAWGRLSVARGDTTNNTFEGVSAQSSLTVSSSRTAGTAFGGAYNTANRNIHSAFTYNPTADDSEFYASNLNTMAFGGTGDSSGGSVSGSVNYVSKGNTGTANEVNGQYNYVSVNPSGASGTTTNVFGTNNYIYNGASVMYTTANNIYGYSSSIDGIGSFVNIGNAYGFYSDIDTNNVSGSAYSFYGNGTAKSYFGGSVGIGTTTPAKALQVLGDIRVGTSSTTSGCLENFNGTGLIGVCASDERLKTNITPVGSVLAKLSLLTPSTFYWNDIAGAELQNSTTTQNYGLIAQNVAQIFPDMVATTSNGYLGVNYSMLPILTLQGLRDVHFDLESIASSTQPVTDTETFAGRFFARMTAWFADAGNGIGDFIANRVHTKTLCVGDSDQGETCITKSELDQLLQRQMIASPAVALPEMEAVVTDAIDPASVADEVTLPSLEISIPNSESTISDVGLPASLEDITPPPVMGDTVVSTESEA